MMMVLMMLMMIFLFKYVFQHVMVLISYHGQLHPTFVPLEASHTVTIQHWMNVKCTVTLCPNVWALTSTPTNYHPAGSTLIQRASPQN